MLEAGVSWGNGDDANDLPVPQVQKTFNNSLCTLLDKHAKEPPSFSMAAQEDGDTMSPVLTPMKCRITEYAIDGIYAEETAKRLFQQTAVTSDDSLGDSIDSFPPKPSPRRPFIPRT